MVAWYRVKGENPSPGIKKASQGRVEGDAATMKVEAKQKVGDLLARRAT